MNKPPIFDVSGVHGASGTSGKDRGHSIASPSAHGRMGGHGTGGQHGTSAGTISVRFTTPTATANIPKNVVLANPIDVDVKVDAYIARAAGQQKEMNTVLKIDSRESMSFLAVGGNGGHGGNGGNGQHGARGKKYERFSFTESISEYARRTVERMQLVTVTVLMAILVATEEMAATQVKAVMLDVEELFESLFPKPIHISLSSVVVVPSVILAEREVQQGNQESEASLFRVILLRPLSEIHFSIRHWRMWWERQLVIHGFNDGRSWS